MTRKLVDVMAMLPKERQERVEARAMELATLKDPRQAVQQTQEQLATALGVGQDPVASWPMTGNAAARRSRSGWP
jgi:DNA-binding transcriptional regulator YiaG